MLSAETVTPLTQGITFAVAGGFFTLVTLLVTTRSKRDMQNLTHADRQADEASRLAEKVADREALIAKETRDYARQDEVARRVAEDAKATMSKLKQVEDLGIVTHALVNSDKTASMRDAREGLIVTLALMREVVSLKEVAGKTPTPETVAATEALVTRIATMQKDIDDRTAQQLAAEAANKVKTPA